MKHTVSLVALLIASLAAVNAHAAVRCTSAAGAVVAYADTASGCPAGSSVKGEVEKALQPNASEQAQAKSLAADDQQRAAALDKQRKLDDKANAKAMLAAQKAADKNKAGKGSAKSCKSAELAVKKAQDKYDDTPSASVKNHKASKASKASKADKNSKTQTHTIVRAEDEKAGKAKKKAKHALENAQAKRALACG